MLNAISFNYLMVLITLRAKMQFIKYLNINIKTNNYELFKNLF